ncbi:OmpA family protein [bacterium]|nr:OmpA family protein [bacterium]
MFNSFQNRRKSKVSKYDIAEENQSQQGREFDSPESDFSGFYVSLVPYSDMMTLLLIFFVFFYLIKDTELGWQNVSEEQSKKMLSENEVAVDSTLYEQVADLNEKVISIPGEILFESGDADLKWSSQATLLEIAEDIEKIISDGDNWSIRIEGHTDNVPISTSRYSSNWELSTARALSIVKFFLRNNYFSPDQLQIMGYGEFKPISPNDTKENRERNRRVEIKLSKQRKEEI